MTFPVPALVEPLTPPDCDLRAYATMPLDVRRLRDSAMADSDNPEVFRAAVLLWCAAWHQVPAASVPNDDRELAKLAGFGRDREAWKRVREEALLGFVMCSDGRLYHRVVAELALPAWESRQRFIERSRKANEARYGGIKNAGAKAGKPAKSGVKRGPKKKDSYKEPNDAALASELNGTERNEVKKTPPLREGEKEDAAPPAPPAPAEPPAPKAKGKREGDGTRLPVGWYAKAEERQYAVLLGFSAEEIDDIEESFRLWWPAQPGAKGRKADWSLTWKSWVRRERKDRDERAKRTGAGGRGSQSTNRIGALYRGGVAAADQRAREQSRRRGGDQGET